MVLPRKHSKCNNELLFLKSILKLIERVNFFAVVAVVVIAVAVVVAVVVIIVFVFYFISFDVKVSKWNTWYNTRLELDRLFLLISKKKCITFFRSSQKWFFIITTVFRFDWNSVLIVVVVVVEFCLQDITFQKMFSLSLLTLVRA